MAPFFSIQPGGFFRGTSRHASAHPTSSTSQPQSARNPVSHNVKSSQQQPHQVPDDDLPTYRDVYSHPAAVAYIAAHPRRTIPKLGPYLLLQTLGENEFGRVKLGLRMEWGEEVAVKLIRRGNIGTSARMSEVEREIEVLRVLKHPNTVRLYDVIETDKYIGIILDYASGGELMDHILAHRYLNEKDACKLFSQLISGVWYIHQKKIIHRHLNLENLLLDRHRNVIITDFSFANRFEHKADDLMQTSCGSPCYDAPELVFSDGMHVGSAVDIWSCGVILYAMLAGYLPFDDDPANPDGDNINLLYKYIVNTPLSFPDYISAEGRDLVSLMLVPDPKYRADIQTVMSHRWLRPGTVLFNQTLGDLEHAAMEQHQQKRLAYQRQLRAAAAEHSGTDSLVSPINDGDVYKNVRMRQDSVSKNDAAPTSTLEVTATTNGTRKASNAGSLPSDQGQGNRKGDFRHTIQVEYNDNAAPGSQQLSKPQLPHRQPSQERPPIFPVKGSEAILEPFTEEYIPPQLGSPLWIRSLRTAPDNGTPQQQHRTFPRATSTFQFLRESESEIERRINEMDNRLGNRALSDRERQKLFNELCKTCSRHCVIPKSMHIPDCSKDALEVECGGYANVFRSTYQGRQVAVKVMRVYITSDLDAILSRFCREGVAWKHLRHPNILPLLGVTLGEHRFAMVSEWMENGNINQFIEKDRQANRAMLLVDVANGLKYMHGLHIVHGDLKGANILINKDRRACIADFGLTTITGVVKHTAAGASQASLISNDSLMSFTDGGTYRWMSPELLDPERLEMLQSEDNRPTKQSDCYALGMTIYEVLCGYHPYVEIQSDILVVNAIMEGARPEKPEGATSLGFSNEMWEIVERCWLEDRNARPGVENILSYLNDAATHWYMRIF